MPPWDEGNGLGGGGGVGCCSAAPGIAGPTEKPQWGQYTALGGTGP